MQQAPGALQTPQPAGPAVRRPPPVDGVASPGWQQLSEQACTVTCRFKCRLAGLFVHAEATLLAVHSGESAPSATSSRLHKQAQASARSASGRQRRPIFFLALLPSPGGAHIGPMGLRWRGRTQHSVSCQMSSAPRVAQFEGQGRYPLGMCCWQARGCVCGAGRAARRCGRSWAAAGCAEQGSQPQVPMFPPTASPRTCILSAPGQAGERRQFQRSTGRRRSAPPGVRPRPPARPPGRPAAGPGRMLRRG